MKNSISALLEDHLGNLWVGTVGGLYRFEKRQANSLLIIDCRQPGLSVIRTSAVFSRTNKAPLGRNRRSGQLEDDGGRLNKLDRKHPHSPFCTIPRSNS
ncbi:two-component regulator propeller domain-containing protein [Salmonirosea aquatica]|uniref:Two component regulator three Y domain-containing protein n=1 Tax=Salmonirosea aquatica TaxID=2654236 RepID=A0A7C9FZS1_9BACT|nr:hypothetical protein [Cytophagaceae bacterium SJW1-29]